MIAGLFLIVMGVGLGVLYERNRKYGTRWWANVYIQGWDRLVMVEDDDEISEL